MNAKYLKCWVLTIFEAVSAIRDTTVQKFGVSTIFKEINTFIHQGCIELIKIDSKDFKLLQNILSKNAVVLNFH